MASVQVLAALFQIQFHANLPGKAVEDRLHVWAPVPMLELWMKLLAFTLLIPLHCSHLESEDGSLSSLYNSAFQMNKSLKTRYINLSELRRW